MDDHETAELMLAMEKNETVTDLDLSHNQIGAQEHLNVVQPDFLTGGEAIAKTLNVRTFEYIHRMNVGLWIFEYV